MQREREGGKKCIHRQANFIIVKNQRRDQTTEIVWQIEIIFGKSRANFHRAVMQ